MQRLQLAQLMFIKHASTEQNLRYFFTLVDSISIWNMPRSSFIQSVGLLNERDHLQGTGCTPPTYQRGNNCFPSLMLTNYHKLKSGTLPNGRICVSLWLQLFCHCLVSQCSWCNNFKMSFSALQLLKLIIYN